MEQGNRNIDFCGINNLLLMLEGHGFNKNDLRKIAARIAAQMGADIILSVR